MKIKSEVRVATFVSMTTYKMCPKFVVELDTPFNEHRTVGALLLSPNLGADVDRAGIFYSSTETNPATLGTLVGKKAYVKVFMTKKGIPAIDEHVVLIES